MAVSKSNAGNRQGNPNLLRQTSAAMWGIGATGCRGGRQGDTLCPRRASPWAVPVMEDRDCHHDSWKFVGHDADPGQSGPGAALVGAVPCQISHTAAVCDSQPGQTGLPGRNCSGRWCWGGQKLSTARLRRQMTPSRNGEPNLQNPQYSWLALGYLPLWSGRDITHELSN